MLECTWSLDSAEMRIDGCILDTILSQSFTAVSRPSMLHAADAVEIFVYDSHSSYIPHSRVPYTYTQVTEIGSESTPSFIVCA